MKKNNIYLIAIIFIFSLLFYVCSSGDNNNISKRKIPVKLDKVKKIEIHIPVHTSGRIFMESQKKLSFKTGGIIKHIHAEAGQKVKRGKVLAELDLSEIGSMFNKAKNGEEKAKRDYKRISNLYNKGAATLEQFQNVKTALEISKSDLKIAAFNLEHSVVKAPSSGIILKRMFEEGEMAGGGHPIFVFGTEGSGWEIGCGLSEINLMKVEKGQKAKIMLTPYPDLLFSGIVSEVSESLNPSSGAFDIRIKFDNEGKRLAAGMIAGVDIFPDDPELFDVVPYSAVVDGDSNMGFVYEISGSTAKKIRVKIIYMSNDFIAVKFANRIPENIVTDGSSYLRDGSEVRIIE